MFRDLWGRRGIPFSCDLWTWEDGSTSSQSYAYTVDVALNLRRQGGVHVSGSSELLHRRQGS